MFFSVIGLPVVEIDLEGLSRRRVTNLDCFGIVLFHVIFTLLTCFFLENCLSSMVQTCRPVGARMMDVMVGRESDEMFSSFVKCTTIK